MRPMKNQWQVACATIGSSRMGFWIAFALLSGVLGAPVAADDWPQWLGPQRDGVWRESGILREFDESGAKVLWRAPVGGGYAGPSVAGGRVYVMDFATDGEISNDPNNRSALSGKERLHCLDAQTGKQIWTHAYPCEYEISYPGGPRVTPLVDGERVYILGAMGHLTCVNAESGEVQWKKSLKDEYKVEVPTWGFCGHPLIEGDRLFCLVGGSGSVAVAFDKRTGKELWRSLDAREPGYCPPTLIQHGGKRQLLIFHSQAVNSLDPETGKPYWSVDIEPNYGMAIAAPQLSGDLLFAGGIRNQSMVLKLKANAQPPEVVWRSEKDRGIGPVNTTPYADGDYLYGVDGRGELRCLEMATGKHLWTSFAATTGSRIVGSATAFLIRHQDRVFLPNEHGDLIIAKLTPQGYQEISRTHVLEPTTVAFGRKVVWSYPAFAYRCMFARNDKEIVCISLADASAQP